MAKAKLEAANEVLTSVNSILTTVFPLVGMVSSMAHALLASLKHQGIEIKGFEEEMARYDAKCALLAANYERWTATHPITEPPQ